MILHFWRDCLLICCGAKRRLNIVEVMPLTRWQLVHFSSWIQFVTTPFFLTIIQGMRHSELFPEGYGDFVLKSSDGVIFHFPRYLLSHVSPVFKDMLEICNHTTGDEALSLTEDSVMLETLLLFIDPVKEARPLNWVTVEGFISVADKYQVGGIPKWFEREVGMERLYDRGMTSPMLCLGLAIRYRLPEVEKHALQHLVKCHVDQIELHPAVDSRFMVHLLKLRTERTRQLSEAIFEIEKNIQQAPKRGSCYIHESDAYGWEYYATTLVIDHPSWEELVSDLEGQAFIADSAGCTCIDLNIPEELDRKMRLLEGSVPELP